MAGKFDYSSIFGDLLGNYGAKPDADGMTLEKKVNLQYELLKTLAAKLSATEERLAEAEKTIVKLKENNNKTIPHVQNLTARVTELEKKKNAAE